MSDNTEADASNPLAVVDVSGDPLLAVARKKSNGRFESFRIDVAGDAKDALRSPCKALLDRFSTMQRLPYAPHGDIESDECYEIDITDLPRRPVGRKPTKSPDTRELALPDLIDFVGDTNDHPVLNAAKLATTQLNLYGIAFPQDDGSLVGFVRQTSPHRSLRSGNWYFSLGDTLKAVDQPNIVIDDQVDLILTSQRLFVFRPPALESLLRDVRLVFEPVGALLADLETRISATTGIDQGSLDALTAVCGRSVGAAKRLGEVVNSGVLTEADKDQTRAVLAERGLAHVLDKAGGFSFGEDHVRDVLDCLAGRLFADGFSGEERRANRYSPR